MTKVTQAERNWVAGMHSAGSLFVAAALAGQGARDSRVRAIIDHIDANPTPKMAAVIEALERSIEGWANAVEFGLVPCGSSDTAALLRDKGRQALSQLKGEG